ncbi:MAG: putative nucleotidyltransferase substrate binding domain-containing protein [Solirubrobacteraceae bacterium]
MILDMEHLDTFLARYPPFDGLGTDALRELTAAAVERELEAGEVVLVEDGEPAAGLWVIHTGSVELAQQGAVVSVLEPGQCFGHPSLLTGMAPTFTVRAREPSRCVWFEPRAARRLLGTEAGVGFVAATMRDRLTHVGEKARAIRDVGTTPVSAIMRPAVFCEPGEPLRSAVEKLGAGGASALLVALDETRLGIVTDADIRARVAAGTTDLDVPVSSIARTPVATVPVGQLAVEATVDMLAAGVEHMPVVERGRICGLLSAADLLGLDAHGPIALRHTILGAPDPDALERAVSLLPQLFLMLARAGVASRDLGRVLSLQHDAVVGRLIDFSLGRHGPAPEAWSWLDLGSAARREFTLSSDQDNALAYGGEGPEIDPYFARLGEEVNEGLARCGVGIDNNGVLAGNRRWRMSKPAWLATFDECLRVPDESHLIRATVAFDFRAAAGGLAVAAELTARMRGAREHAQFMHLMARSASGYSVALNFRGQLSTERDGDHAGRIDLKRGGIIPLVNLVRYHSMATGVTISSTLDRIEAVAAAGGLEHAQADALAEAFEAITQARFAHHADLISAGQPADNHLDPAALAPIARTELREALQIVKRAQKRLPV